MASLSTWQRETHSGALRRTQAHSGALRRTQPYSAVCRGACRGASLSQTACALSLSAEARLGEKISTKAVCRHRDAATPGRGQAAARAAAARARATRSVKAGGGGRRQLQVRSYMCAVAMVAAIRGHPRPSEAIRGHPRPSEAIRGHPRPSVEQASHHEDVRQDLLVVRDNVRLQITCEFTDADACGLAHRLRSVTTAGEYDR